MFPVRQEVRYAARSLRRSPLASGAIVATLAICIAAIAAVYAVVDVVLVRGLPFDRPEQLLWVSSVSKDRPDRPFSLPEFLDYRAQATSVQIVGYTTWNAIFETPAGAQRLQGLRMTADGLAILGAGAPSAGRLLMAGDDAPAAPRVAVLGYGYWRRTFAGDPRVVGRTLLLNGERVTVVGVLPKLLPLSVRDVDAIVPLRPGTDPRRNERGSVNFLRMVVRRAPTATTAAAERELNVIAARLRERFPTEYAAKLGVKATPLQEYLAATQRPTLIVLLACVALMAAVALANVLNLLLARAVSRQGETAVRLALGASVRRIAVQLLIEGALLVLAAGAIGLVLGDGALSYATSHLAAITPRIDEARLSVRVLGVLLAVCTGAVLLFSLTPILIARAIAPQTALRAAGRSGGASAGQVTLRSSFVVAEMALAVIITAATAAFVQSLITLERVNLGYRPDSVFVARVSLPPKAYSTPSDLARFSTEMTAALLSASGVIAAGGASIAPLSGVGRTVPFAPAQGGPALRRDWPATDLRAVSPGYLAAIGARLVVGRPIAAQDDGTAPPVAVINQTLADRYFAATGAVGRQLLIDDTNAGPRAVTIVGVVADLREDALDGPMKPAVYVALTQVHRDELALVAATQFWAVRLRGSAAGFGPAFLRTLRTVDPAAATAGLTDLRAYVDGAIAPRLFSVRVLVGFTVISLLLAMLGVYGITAYTVEQRRREIGLRIALGATPRGILALILGRTLRLACVGVFVGLVVAYAAGGFMARLMFGVSPANPAILALVAGILLSTALVASWVPARRAAHVDALRALAAE